jgi:DNA repair exonuclease SbcCD ATPase subunit
LTEQDTSTPQALNTIYEQITCGTVVHNNLSWHSIQPDEGHNEEVEMMTDLCVGYSHLEVQLENRECELQQALEQKEKQAQEARNKKHEEKMHRLRVQHICTEFVDSQSTLRLRLEASRTREEKLQGDLLAAEQECGNLKKLIYALGASERKREELITAAEARREEAERASLELRVSLTGALDGAREAQEQWDRQTKLASDKECLLQSTSEELQVALAKLKDAEDEIARLVVKLQRERDRRVRETKVLLDEQVRIQNRYKSEMHRIIREAKDAHEQLNALYDVLSRLGAGERSSLGGICSPRQRLETTQPCDTGQPPPPEPILDIGTPPVCPNSEPSSPRFSVSSSRHLPEQYQRSSFTSRPSDLRQISAWFEEVSGAAKAQRVAMEDLLGRMCQLEFERDQVVDCREGEKKHLQEELAVTSEQLRLTQEDVFNLRRDLDQEKEARREAETNAKGVEYELVMCQAKLQEVQDARRTGRIKFVEAVELLRLRSADVESLKDEAEATEIKCSQVTLLSAVLRERVMDLEAEVERLKCVQSCSATTAARTPSPLICSADSGLRAADFCSLVR